jgi:hypothetical protein
VKEEEWMSETGGYGARERPICVAIVICNEVIEDKRTNNKSLIGLFNSIVTTAFPAQHARMFVMVSLTDGRGEWPLSLVIRGPSGEPIFQSDGKLRFDDPLAVLDIVAELRMLPLPEAGEYRLEVVCGGELVASRRFNVVQAEGQPT